MTINFTHNYQFNTRLYLEDTLLEQVHETRLLGLVINDKLSWQSNTTSIVINAYKRMRILHKLYDFSVPVEDLVEVYILYIRSVLESSAVVWHSSLTQGQELEIEKVQKVALRMTMCSLKTLKNPRTKEMFPLRNQSYESRNPERYIGTQAHTYMQRLLNSN